MTRMSRVLLSAIIVFGISLSLVEMATAAEQPRRTQRAAPARSDLPVAPRVCSSRGCDDDDEGPYDRYKGASKVYPGLVDILRKCKGEASYEGCLAELIKSREYERDRYQRAEAKLEETMGLIDSFHLDLRRYLERNRDEVARMGETELAGKLSVAIAGIYPAVDAMREIRQILREKKDAVDKKDTVPPKSDDPQKPN